MTSGTVHTTDGILETLALASQTPIRWETDDIDIVTDGGRDISRQSDRQYEAGHGDDQNSS